MNIGDLVLSGWGETAILLTEPRPYADDTGLRNTKYYVADVLTEGGHLDNWITDDVEIISEGR